jgi:hypothetical protein
MMGLTFIFRKKGRFLSASISAGVALPGSFAAAGGVSAVAGNCGMAAAIAGSLPCKRVALPDPVGVCRIHNDAVTAVPNIVMTSQYLYVLGERVVFTVFAFKTAGFAG